MNIDRSIIHQGANGTMSGITNEESKLEFLDDCLYQVCAKYVTWTEGDVVLDRFNASAEEAMFDHDSSSIFVANAVLKYRLVETGFGSKKGLAVYLKDYIKNLMTHFERKLQAR
ncbi:unnamed protein product [Lepeophtheirus salmonis]|uniref:(salmon louse) hypothetical protein n=1 Tax=Lepeophtheirus salmonis TaxID=72036 RepID=A0A7R8D5Z3_LEPSM|nr:unnamed protein product [Lepeophtheirus salmonis]CAF3039924.1 unnamed protein product [Lepeophtheirus salmonis]